ncbi:MAG: hypothetical protein WC408_02125 [Candidatus Micrarchaeia archaeon]
MALSKKTYEFLLPLVGLLLVAGAIFFVFPSASAYAACSPGQLCDATGQTCTYYLPTDSLCKSTLTCNSYNISNIITIPHDNDCYCMQRIEITRVDDKSLQGGDADVSFQFSVRHGNIVTYSQETVYGQKLLFDSGSMTCSGCKYNNPVCASGQHCDTSRNICIDDYDSCDWWEYYSGGMCRLRSGYCYSDGDCGYDEECSNHVCAYKHHDDNCGWWQYYDGWSCHNNPGYCTYSSDCSGYNSYCDSSYHTCRNGGYNSCSNCDYSYQYCDDGVCRSNVDHYDSCYDSDGGRYPDTFGRLTGYDFGSYKSRDDYCIGDYVSEGYCSGNDFESSSYYCENGCSNGKCNSGPYSGSCYETDDGYDLENYGVAHADSGTVEDRCINNYVLRESYCEDGEIRTTEEECQNYCQNGECINSNTRACSEWEYYDYNEKRCRISEGRCTQFDLSKCYSNGQYCSSDHYCTFGSSSTGSSSSTGEYHCSSGEYVCGLDCEDYYYISATCGSVMKSYCQTHSVNYLSIGPVCKDYGASTVQCSLTLAYNANTQSQEWMINEFDDPKSIGGQYCRYDPPVNCNAYLTGPGLSRTSIGTYPFETFPDVVYSPAITVNRSYFKTQGTYTLDVNCKITLPTNSTECNAGCGTAGATVSFHVDTCGTTLSMETDKYQYYPGDVMTIYGKVKNNNIPISTTIHIGVYNAAGTKVGDIPVLASNGEYTTNWIVPSDYRSGAYILNATAQFNACAPAASNIGIGVTSCSIDVSAAVSQKGFSNPATVSGTVSNYAAPLSGANVTVMIYKDGSLYRQSFGATLVNGNYAITLPGPYSDGTFSTQVSIGYNTCKQVSTYTSPFGGGSTGSFSGSCDLHVINAAAKFSESSGGLLVTGTLADGNNTAVAGTYNVEARDSAGAVAGSASGSTSSNGAISVTIANLAAGKYDVVITSSSGPCSATDKVSTNADYTVMLFSSPTCGTTSGNYQVKLKNNQQSSTTVTIAYSSISKVAFSGPSSVNLDGNSEKVISIDVAFADGFSGGSIGIVNFNNGNDASAQSLELPICAVGNIRLNIIDKMRSGSIGQQMCYKMYVENRGPESGTVTLSYESGAYYTNGVFNFQQFRLSSYETRDDLEFCATVPNSQFSVIPIVVRATAPFGTTSDTVALSNSATSSDISVSFSGCPYITAGMQFPISLYNNGETGNYVVELSDNGYLHPAVNSPVIYNFARNSNQIVTISVSPSGLWASNYVTLYIRKEGAIVKQQQLCFQTVGAKNASSNYASSLYGITRQPLSTQSSDVNLSIYPPQFYYYYNGSNFVANASFLVQNNEDRALNIEATVTLPSGWNLSYSPRAMVIAAGDMREFVVVMSASDFEKKQYNGVFTAADPNARKVRAQFTLDASDAGQGAGILTGFVSGAMSSYGLGILVLIAIGGVLLVGIRKNYQVIG